MASVSPHPRPRATVILLAVITALTVAAPRMGGTAQREPDVPDLQGTYDTGTLTPLERPASLGGRRVLSPEEAQRFTRDFLRSVDSDRRNADPRVDVAQSYNNVFFDRGAGMAMLDGEIRSSILVEPPDGRMPSLTPAGRRRSDALGRRAFPPYDDPEGLPPAERCLLGIGSATGPPLLPALYNNRVQVVQTPGQVLIATEMVHEARVVRLGGRHLPASVRRWAGDSVGRYEGETLVIDTTNFRADAGYPGASDRLRVTERISRVDGRTLRYRFTVDDPDTWVSPWTGEYPWVETADPVLEYACHEGNRALEHMLRGARFGERGGTPAATPR